MFFDAETDVDKDASNDKGSDDKNNKSNKFIVANNIEL